MKKLYIPSVDELLAPGDTPKYPYNPNFEDAKNDPIFVLHTSGSTGTFSNLVLLCFANFFNRDT